MPRQSQPRQSDGRQRPFSTSPRPSGTLTAVASEQRPKSQLSVESSKHRSKSQLSLASSKQGHKSKSQLSLGSSQASRQSHTSRPSTASRRFNAHHQPEPIPRAQSFVNRQAFAAPQVALPRYSITEEDDKAPEATQASQGDESRSEDKSEGSTGSDTDSETESRQESNRLTRAQRAAVAQCPIRTRRTRLPQGTVGRKAATLASRGLSYRPSSSSPTSGTRTSGRRRGSLASIVDEAFLEAKALKATAEQFMHSRPDGNADRRLSVTSNAVDVMAYQVLQGSAAEDPMETDDFAARARWQRRRDSLNSIKELTGLGGPSQSDYAKMAQKGMFHCGVKDKYIDARRNVVIKDERADRMSKEEMKRRLHEQLPVDGSRLTGEGLLKSLIDAPCLEGMWRNNQGGNAIRRKPQEHEAVFDFGDSRITMPRYLSDDKAGQLVSCRPVFNADGTQGFVVMTTKVPHRQLAGEEVRIEAICDIEDLERRAKKMEEERPHKSLQRHAHLHQARLPPFTADVQAWRNQAEEKRRAMQEAQTWQAMQKRRQANKKEEHRQSDGQTGDDEEAEPERAAIKSSSKAASRSSSKALSSRRGIEFSRNDTIDFVSSAPPGASPQEIAKVGERLRRMGMDLTAHGELDDVPWDARPPLPEPEVEKFFQRIAFKDETPAATRRRASIDASNALLHAQRAEEQTWTLSAVGPLDFALTFSASLDRTAQFASQAESRNEAQQENLDGDDAFWEDFFQPAAGTGRELRCFGACGC